MLNISILLILSEFLIPRLVDFKAFQTSGAVGEIRIEWSVQEESGVDKYAIRRKMQRDADFIDLSEVEARNLGFYQFSDKNVFKLSDQTEQVFYAVYAINDDGSRELLGQTGVQYSANSVRRTWGSIKAMFQ